MHAPVSASFSFAFEAEPALHSRYGCRCRFIFARVAHVINVRCRPFCASSLRIEETAGDEGYWEDQDESDLPRDGPDLHESATRAEKSLRLRRARLKLRFSFAEFVRHIFIVWSKEAAAAPWHDIYRRSRAAQIHSA